MVIKSLSVTVITITEFIDTISKQLEPENILWYMVYKI